jgi:hypothetical protein
MTEHWSSGPLVEQGWASSTPPRSRVWALSELSALTAWGVPGGSARHTTARVLGALFTRSVCTHYSSMRASAAAFMMWDSSGVVLTLWWESLSRWLVHASGLRVLSADDMCCLFAYLSPEAAQHTH